jgi:hypothetical protein
LSGVTAGSNGLISRRQAPGDVYVGNFFNENGFRAYHIAGTAT